eukprot:scaffold15953_cov112-Isochrysis_galbana.AAC.1
MSGSTTELRALVAQRRPARLSFPTKRSRRSPRCWQRAGCQRRACSNSPSAPSNARTESGRPPGVPALSAACPWMRRRRPRASAWFRVAAPPRPTRLGAQSRLPLVARPAPSARLRPASPT